MTATRTRRVVLRLPGFLDGLAPWDPLASTAYELYREEGYARAARPRPRRSQSLATAYQQLARFEDASLAVRARVAAGRRAYDLFRRAREGTQG